MPFNLDHQILEEAQQKQSTHNHVTSNAAALLAIRLAGTYFLQEHNARSSSQAASSSSVTAASSSSSTEEHSSMTLGISQSSAGREKMRRIRARYERRAKSSVLEPSTRGWLSTILDNNILNKEIDRVTLVEEHEGKRVSTVWYLPLPEVFSLVLCALMDKHEQAWPVPPGSTATKERLLRLQKFDRINNELMNETPSVCSAGIRHRWLMALDGYEGKRLPLNAEDVLMQGLFDFMVHEVLATHLKLKLPDGRDPAGNEYIPFYEQFQTLFLPWIFDTIPDHVKAAINNAGQEDAAKQYILNRFRSIQTIPSDKMLIQINGYCSNEGLESIPCHFVPVLAALDRFAKRHAMAVGSERIAATSLHSLASQTIGWLRGSDFSPESLKRTAAEKNPWDTVYLVMRLHDVLHQFNDYQNLLDVCDMPPEQKAEWIEALHALGQWLNNQELSLHVLLADTPTLEQHLRAFERGVILWRSNTYYDFISNYTAQWFAANNGAQASLFGRLCELFFNENTPEALSNPVIRVDEALLSKWITQTDEDGTLDVSPYQINRIILHALCYEPNTWSPLFLECLKGVLSFIRNRCNQGLNSAGQALSRDSWPQELIDQIEHLFDADTVKQVILTPGNITPGTSLRISYLLAMSRSMPERIIRKIVEHPGFDPNATDHRYLTPFYIAAEFGNIPFAKALRAKAAHCNVKYKSLFTPMVAAFDKKHLSFIQWFIQTLDESNALKELTTKDVYGFNLMQRLASNPQNLIDILRCLPVRSRKEALLAGDKTGFNALFLFAQHPLFIKDVLNCLPECERASVFMSESVSGFGMFEKNAFLYPKIVEPLLESLPKNKKEQFLLSKSQDGKTMLHHLAESYPQLLIKTVSYLPKKRRISLLRAKNNDNVSVLRQAAKSHPEILKQLLLLLPTKDRYSALMKKNRKGNTLLHHVSERKGELLIELVDLLKIKHRIKAIIARNKNGDTILHEIVSRNPETLQWLLNYLSLSDVMSKDKWGYPLLHKVANNPPILLVLLDFIPDTAKADTAKTCNNYGETIAHRVAHIPESRSLFFKWLPQTEYFAVLMARNKSNLTVLELIAKNDCDMLIQLLDSLSETEKYAALIARYENGQTLLHLLVETHPSYLIQLMDYLPEDERMATLITRRRRSGKYRFIGKLTNIPETEYSGCENVLEILAQKNVQYLIQLLYCLPEEARVAAIKVENEWDQSLALQVIIHFPHLAKGLFDCLPSTRRTDALKSRGSYDNTLLHKIAIRCKTRLRELLESLTETEILDVLMTRDKEGNTELHKILNEPSAVEVIMGCLPEAARADVVKSCNNKQLSVMHLAVSYPDSLQILLDYLPITEKANAVLFCGRDDYSSIKHAERLSKFKSLSILNAALEQTRHNINTQNTDDLSRPKQDKDGTIPSLPSSSVSDSSPIHDSCSFFRRMEQEQRFKDRSDKESELDAMDRKSPAL
ncbi:ankyrin repeat domain-containing protein [Legionella worsleiensis]|nr:ankyrin repeat domain-containing protein [Legionella worsleiensis]STY33132.1 Ankyrin repeats (3 copies) [Legionella worsleiensis]